MRSILLTILFSITIWSNAQVDTSSVDDILYKLSKLEKLKGANDTVSSLKIITDREYAEALQTGSLLNVEANIVMVDTTVLQPVIKFDTATYNMGTIEQGVVAKQKFVFTNEGTDDLEIISVVADCSCTSPDWSKKPIKPGEKGYVIATYDSKEDIGKFMKTITVLHNSGDGWSYLEINGFVAPKL